MEKVIAFAATQTAADIIFIAKVDKTKQKAEKLINYLEENNNTRSSFKLANLVN